jgi:hypothetical protein
MSAHQAAEALISGRCEVFQRSEVARANALLAAANAAKGKLRIEGTLSY